MIQNLILRHRRSPGDVLMLTAALRDLHRQYPKQFKTDIRTPFEQLWANNPYVTPLNEATRGTRIIDCDYPGIHQSNQNPNHFVGAFHRFLAEALELPLEVSEFRADIYLNETEKDAPPFPDLLPATYWLISAGGKRDFTIKWWDRKRFQKVVDHFRDRVTFVQVGAAGDYHPALSGTVDLRGRTDIRQLISLVHHAEGVISPVSFLMHLSAAVDLHERQLAKGWFLRPAIIIAGGREPVHWESYPGHQFLHTVGMLKCCAHGGCWKSRVKPLEDGSEHDEPSRLCVDVVNHLPRCMDLITAEDVIRRLEMAIGSRASKNPPIPETANRSATHRSVPRVTSTYHVLTRHSARPEMEMAVSRIPEYPSENFLSKGIVMCAGGESYAACAWVAINMVRHFGCGLPVKLWFMGEEEMPPPIQKLFEPLNVECVDAMRIRRAFPVRRMAGWELKPYALIHSGFKEAIFLDADNVPLFDVSRIFEWEQFKKHGAVLWPDIGRLSSENAIWELCGIKYRDEPEVESGQMAFDLPRVWKALNLALWMNEHSDFFYQYVHGDKETFHLAFRYFGQEYSMPKAPAKISKATLLQHDFSGRLIFQHRNLAKWTTLRENLRFPEFKFERLCLKYLSELAAAPAWKQWQPGAAVSIFLPKPTKSATEDIFADASPHAPRNASGISSGIISSTIPDRLLPTRVRIGFKRTAVYDINLAILTHCKDGDISRMLSMKQCGALNAKSLRVHISIIGSPGDFHYADALCNGWNPVFDVSMIEMSSRHPVPKINGYYLWLMKSGPQARWHGRVDDDSLTDLAATVEYLDQRFGDYPVHASTYPLIGIEASPHFAKYLEKRKINFPEKIREYESSFTSRHGMEQIFSNPKAYQMIMETGTTFDDPGDCALAIAAHISGVLVVPNPKSHSQFYPDRFSLFGGDLHHIHYVPWKDAEICATLSALTSDFQEDLKSECIEKLFDRPLCYHRGFRAVALLTLRPDGTIIGGENESVVRWDFSSSTLYLLSNSEQVIASFNLSSNLNNELIMKGFGLRDDKPFWLRPLPFLPEETKDFPKGTPFLKDTHLHGKKNSRRNLKNSIVKALCSSPQLFSRIGNKSGWVAFLPEGRIKEDVSSDEHRWVLRFENESPVLKILKKNKLLYWLKLYPDAIWRGFEPGAEKSPLAILASLNEADRARPYGGALQTPVSAMAVLTGYLGHQENPVDGSLKLHTEKSAIYRGRAKFLTSEDVSKFLGMPLEFGRFFGPALYPITLRKSGAISGADHENESKWMVRDSALHFCTSGGKSTTKFDIVLEFEDRRWLIGLFNNGRTVHYLTHLQSKSALPIKKSKKPI